MAGMLACLCSGGALPPAVAEPVLEASRKGCPSTFGQGGRRVYFEVGTSGQVEWRVRMRHASPATAVQAGRDHARVAQRLLWAGDGHRQGTS
jgi:hypothetical protein